MDLMAIRRGLMAQMTDKLSLLKIGSISVETAITTTSAAYNVIKDFAFESGKTYLITIDGNTSTDTSYNGMYMLVHIAPNSVINLTTCVTYVRPINSTMSTATSYLFDITVGSSLNIYVLD